MSKKQFIVSLVAIFAIAGIILAIILWPRGPQGDISAPSKDVELSATDLLAIDETATEFLTLFGSFGVDLDALGSGSPEQSYEMFMDILTSQDESVLFFTRQTAVNNVRDKFIDPNGSFTVDLDGLKASNRVDRESLANFSLLSSVISPSSVAKEIPMPDGSSVLITEVAFSGDSTVLYSRPEATVDDNVDDIDGDGFGEDHTGGEPYDVIIDSQNVPFAGKMVFSKVVGEDVWKIRDITVDKNSFVFPVWVTDDSSDINYPGFDKLAGSESFSIKFRDASYG